MRTPPDRSRVLDREIELQKALPLIALPHAHPGPAGTDRHTLLFVGREVFRVCPRDCADRSRTSQPTKGSQP
jgi:hypothetical protein